MEDAAAAIRELEAQLLAERKAREEMIQNLTNLQPHIEQLLLSKMRRRKAIPGADS